MFKWPSNRIELFRLNRNEKKLEREGERKRAEARKKKDQSILENWFDSYADDAYREIRWERKKLVSNALLTEADELHVPRPQYGDVNKWEKEDDEYGRLHGFVLTSEAITELRATIRKERREGREDVEWWVKILGGLLTIITGLVGALIGLASVWRHK